MIRITKSSPFASTSRVIMAMRGVRRRSGRFNSRCRATLLSILRMAVVRS